MLGANSTRLLGLSVKINHEIDPYNSHLFFGGTIDDFSVKAPDDFDAEQQATIEQVPIIQQKTTTVGLTWKRKIQKWKREYGHCN